MCAHRDASPPRGSCSRGGNTWQRQQGQLPALLQVRSDGCAKHACVIFYEIVSVRCNACLWQRQQGQLPALVRSDECVGVHACLCHCEPAATRKVNHVLLMYVRNVLCLKCAHKTYTLRHTCSKNTHLRSHSLSHSVCSAKMKKRANVGAWVCIHIHTHVHKHTHSFFPLSQAVALSLQRQEEEEGKRWGMGLRPRAKHLGSSEDSSERANSVEVRNVCLFISHYHVNE